MILLIKTTPLLRLTYFMSKTAHFNELNTGCLD